MYSCHVSQAKAAASGQKPHGGDLAQLKSAPPAKLSEPEVDASVRQNMWRRAAQLAVSQQHAGGEIAESGGQQHPNGIPPASPNLQRFSSFRV